MPEPNARIQCVNVWYPPMGRTGKTAAITAGRRGTRSSCAATASTCPAADPRCGPCATQIRWIDAGRRPWVAALDRKLHCVARGGARCSGASTTGCSRAAVLCRFRPRPGASRRNAATRRASPPPQADGILARIARAYLASHARPTRRCDCERPTAAGWCRRAPSAPMWHAARRSAAMRQLDSWAARYQTVRLSSFAITALDGRCRNQMRASSVSMSGTPPWAAREILQRSLQAGGGQIELRCDCQHLPCR